MNKFIFILLLLSYHSVNSQNQIGQNLNGEMEFDVFGYTTSISSNGNKIAIGASRHDGAGVDYGHVKIYEYDCSNWIQVGSTINGLHNYNELGNRVSLSADGNIIAISNRNYLDTPSTLSNKSEVIVYEFNGSDWVQLGQNIRGKSIADLFGNAISLSKDGTRLAIGADKRSTGASGQPYVQVFEYSSGSWVQLGQELEGILDSAFGGSVSLSSQGDILAVGSPNENKAYTYEFNGSDWVRLGEELFGEFNDDFFGTQVSISDSGKRLAIGAHGNDGNGSFSGHVRVFNFISNSWVQIGNDIDGEATEDISGTSVSLSSDGNSVAVGAYRNDGNGNNSGHVRIYNYDSGEWIQAGIDLDGANADDESGFSVALSGDGSRVVIGSPKNDDQASNAGQVRVFDYNNIPLCTNLTSPINDATNVSISSNIDWTAITNATGYFISIGITPGGTEIVNREDLGNVTTYDPSTDFSENQNIYITIVPYNCIGEATACSEESFLTETLDVVPSCTSLSAPLNDATDVSISSNIEWTAIENATGYYITVGTTPGGAEIVNREDVGNVTTYNPPMDFSENQTIYVTVIPYNSFGEATACSEESFLTETLDVVPSCTNLSAPLDSATDVAISSNIEWTAIENATGYYITVGTTPGGTEIVNREDLGNVTIYDPTNDFAENQNIYVTVNPYNSIGEAIGCSEESFLTEYVGLVIPKFFTPNNDGFNDYWQIAGLSSDRTISIYDRYGKLLKQLSTNTRGWDGTYNGQPMPSSDYWFKVSLDNGMSMVRSFSLKR